MYPQMTAPAERDHPSDALNAWPTMMHQQPRESAIATAPARVVIPLHHRFAQSAEVLSTQPYTSPGLRH
jgi:hypothetical protein